MLWVGLEIGTGLEKEEERTRVLKWLEVTMLWQANWKIESCFYIMRHTSIAELEMLDEAMAFHVLDMCVV